MYRPADFLTISKLCQTIFFSLYFTSFNVNSFAKMNKHKKSVWPVSGTSFPTERALKVDRFFLSLKYIPRWFVKMYHFKKNLKISLMEIWNKFVDWLKEICDFLNLWIETETWQATLKLRDISFFLRLSCHLYSKM